MSVRWGAVLALAVISLSPLAATADEAKGASPHIAAAQSFLMAWGRGNWDEMRAVSTDTVNVQVGDKAFAIEPGARKSEVTMQFPFRGLSTLRNGTEVKGVAVSELGVRIGDKELRGPATVMMKDDGGQMRIFSIAVDGAR